MSMNKLLVSAAASALIAGSAAALEVTQADADSATGLTGTVITSAQIVAEEASFAAAGSDVGIFELRVDATGTFAASENYFVDVTVSGGTFSQDLTGAEVTDGDVPTGITVSGSSVQIAGQTQTGQEGENAVRFLVSNDNVVGDNFGLEMPIQYSGCPSDLNFTISIQTTNGVTFEEGTVSLDDAALTCGNAYMGSIATDVVAGANDSFLDSILFESYEAGVSTSATDAGADGTTTAGPNDSATTATHGVLTVEFNPAGLTLPGGAFVTELNDGANALSTITGTATDVTSATFDVTVGDPTGLDSANTEEGADTDAFSAGGVASLTVAANVAMAVNDLVENITLSVLTGASSAQVAQQAVTSTNGLLNFADATLVDDEPIADATLDDLNYEGETCETFDWVGDATKPTANIWRVTGAGSATSDVIVTLSNSSNGASFDGSYTMQSYDFTQPEVVITNSQIGAVAGEFGRADVLFNFIGATTALDCDRLMNSDAENIITAFGNNNSVAGTGVDGDD